MQHFHVSPLGVYVLVWLATVCVIDPFSLLAGHAPAAREVNRRDGCLAVLV
jgi:hypothetical protein